MDKYTDLRAALEAGPTPGPWTNHGRIPQPGLPHSSVVAKTLIARVYSEAFGDAGQETANANLIAAANPETIRDLLAERDRLRSALEVARIQIELDMDALIVSHGVINSMGVRAIPKEDALGREGLHEYNKTLEFINSALAQEQS